MLVAGQYRQKFFFNNYSDVSVELPNGDGNERELGIVRWDKIGIGFKFEMGRNWCEKSVPAHLYYYTTAHKNRVKR